MTLGLHLNRLQKILTILGLSVGLTLTHTGHAAPPVNLSQVPLTTATTLIVKPNIMFTLDDSGSMDWDFMPDWVGYSPNSRAAQPDLYRNSAWNVAFYNPAVTYKPPVLFNATDTLDSTTYPNMASPWTSVKYDAFGVRGYSTNIDSRPDQLCPDGTVPTGTAVTNYACDLSGGKAVFFTFVPAEYCDAVNLKNCITGTDATHINPALVRWCNNAALLQSPAPNVCQSTRTGAFTFPRYPGQLVPSSATLTVGSTNSSTSVSSVKVNGVEILSATTSGNNNSNTVASRIVNAINACTAATTGACAVAGYSASSSNNVVTVFAPTIITDTPVVTKASGSKTITATAFGGAMTVPGSVVKTSIVSGSYPYPGTTIKHKNRTDCAAGSPCTYDQEMTNYANWFTYYHVRHDMIKSGVSRAFQPIDNKFRVGFNLINEPGVTNNSGFLNIDTFEKTHRNSWYKKLFAATLNGSTPLQGSLGKVGRYFANKADVGTVKQPVDPMQYSCQQNFAILSTDGYWNGSSNDYSLSKGLVGDLDGGTTPLPLYEGKTATKDSLADIAKYYYETDLRTVALDNCTSGATGETLCANPPAGKTEDIYNNVFVSATDNNTKQHMTLFTIGLGADGTLVYQGDYTTAKTGDFADLKAGAIEWSDPINNTDEERIDDLWHAAVNGRGEYYSAKNPDDIVNGLTKALASIKAKVGAGAAAATSTLNPVASDNNAYVASYTTVSWRGNLETRKIDLATGATSATATFCVEDVVDASLAIVCTGTLKDKVFASSDKRKIYMKNSTGDGLEDFLYAKMTSAQKANFDTTATLSLWGQWVSLTDGTATVSGGIDANQRVLATGAELVNYLRGQTGYEDRSANTNKLYRAREATLGDAVESQPIFIGKPTFSYTDSGYDKFITDQTGRAKTVFLGANDGMLHAFDATTLEERWAYVPSMVMPNMWKLADKDYATLHNYYVNGPAVTGDVYDPVTSKWRSILVGSLHGGGRGFYALDVTDPTKPLFLWELTTAQQPDLGYSFAEAKIGKLPPVAPSTVGLWKVFLPSGYNNTSPGDGRGHIYVLDPITGKVDSAGKIDVDSTAIGSTDKPSGLAKIEFYADASERDNTVKFIYGGDLDGNVWRVTPSDNGVYASSGGATAGAIVYSKLKFAVLKDDKGIVQPITTRPELAKISDKRVIYMATGKYLETSDLLTTQIQSVYAIKDDDATVTFINPRSATTGADQMVQQTWSNSSANRTSTGNAVNFVSERGWWADLPDSGERANVDPRLEFGTLLVPTTVPASSACTPGGYGWLNFVNFSTGASATGVVTGFTAQRTNTPVVGVNVISLPDGSIKVSTVEAGDPTPKVIPGVPFNTKSGGFQAKRVIWRELVQ
jgi:type IV pilus assembly protein PilY1